MKIWPAKRVACHVRAESCETLKAPKIEEIRREIRAWRPQENGREKREKRKMKKINERNGISALSNMKESWRESAMCMQKREKERKRRRNAIVKWQKRSETQYKAQQRRQ